MMFAPLESWRHVKVTDRHPGVVDMAESGRGAVSSHGRNRRRQIRVGEIESLAQARVT
jgi:hypothetical protein